MRVPASPAAVRARTVCGVEEQVVLDVEEGGDGGPVRAAAEGSELDKTQHSKAQQNHRTIHKRRATRKEDLFGPQ